MFNASTKDVLGSLIKNRGTITALRSHFFTLRPPPKKFTSPYNSFNDANVRRINAVNLKADMKQVRCIHKNRSPLTLL